jgi:hypothetical protein
MVVMDRFLVVQIVNKHKQKIKSSLSNCNDIVI